VVLPETALLLGFPRGLRGLYGLLSEVGEVPPLYPERSILHVAFHQLWLHLTGELAAVLSLVVGILGQDDRRVFVAQRRVLEVHRCLLFAFSGFVPSGIFGALLRARAATGDGGEGEQDEARARSSQSRVLLLEWPVVGPSMFSLKGASQSYPKPGPLRAGFLLPLTQPGAVWAIYSQP
jgi:hypothetical protein